MMTQTPKTHCPDWSSLLAHRDMERYEEAWGRAMEHLDECESCRENAFAFEPTLMFQDLPSLEVKRDDVEDMKQAVAAMRRAQTLEKQDSSGHPFRWALRAAAIAGVGLAMLLLQGTLDLPTSTEGTQTAQLAEAVSDTRMATDLSGNGIQAGDWGSSALPVHEHRPLVEEVEPLPGTVIQLVDSEIDMVVFYSDNLDV